MELKDVKQQDKLKPRAAPYWHELATGQHLGLRKTLTSCTWIARSYDGQKQVKHSLGDFGYLQPNERFSKAQKLARQWFAHLNAGGSVEIITVRQACECYAKHLELTGGKKGGGLSPEAKAGKAREARRRFAQYIDNDPIAQLTLPKLQKRHVEAWRQRLEGTPAAFERAGLGAGRGKGRGTHTRPRAVTTVDRDISPLRSALELAREDGFVLSNVAWKKALKPSNVHRQRDLYLDRDQRRALLAHITDKPMRAFVSALAVIPLRVGAMAALRVADFDARLGMLRIVKDKAGQGRSVTLPTGAVALLKEAAKGKLPSMPLFARWDGKAHRPWEWGRAIKAAAKAAGLPAETCAYTLRHCGISDLATSGVDLFTVATLSGTSVAMIESHYAKFQQDVARDALAGLAL